LTGLICVEKGSRLWIVKVGTGATIRDNFTSNSSVRVLESFIKQNLLACSSEITNVFCKGMVGIICRRKSSSPPLGDSEKPYLSVYSQQQCFSVRHEWSSASTAPASESVRSSYET
jgi:hypothetical protein